jgi:hypothetical protein
MYAGNGLQMHILIYRIDLKEKSRYLEHSGVNLNFSVGKILKVIYLVKIEKA